MNVSPGRSWFLLQTGSRSIAENMAVDDFLLGSAVEFGRPLLRFYSWNETGATFGYAQHFREVSSLTHLKPLVRRPTGGGLVPHVTDWTYSCVFPPGDPWYALKAAESYGRLHEWLSGAFGRLGVEATLTPRRQEEGPGQCFVGAEVSDLMRDGFKMAGAAQRRTRRGLLIQGSVQPPPPGLAKADWQKAVCDWAYHRWGVAWASFDLDVSMERAVEELTRGKYATDAYNRKR